MDVFISPSAVTKECWMTYEENCRAQSGCSESLAHFFFSQNGLVLDHPMRVSTTVSGQCYSTLVPDKVRPAVCCKQTELHEHVILLQDNAIPHCHCSVQNLVQHLGWEVLDNLLVVHILAHAVTGSLHMWKNITVRTGRWNRHCCHCLCIIWTSMNMEL
jgi:hypothetical protein